MNVTEAAAALGIPEHTVRRFITSGRLSATRSGYGARSAYDLSPAEVERFKRDGGAGAALSINEAAARLGFSAETVRRRCAAGDIEATQVGGPNGSWRIPARAIENLVGAGPRGAFDGDRCLLCGVEIVPVEERDGDIVSHVSIEVRSQEGTSAKFTGTAHGFCGDSLTDRAAHGLVIEVTP